MRLGYFSLSQNLPLKMVLGCKSIKINFLSTIKVFLEKMKFFKISKIDILSVITNLYFLRLVPNLLFC